MYFVFVEDVSLEIVETIEEVKKYYEEKMSKVGFMNSLTRMVKD